MRIVQTCMLSWLSRCSSPPSSTTRTYDEPAVNDVLREVHDDFAALRRLIVDEGVMTRDRASVYCRTHRAHETSTGQPAPANVLTAPGRPSR